MADYDEQRETMIRKITALGKSKGVADWVGLFKIYDRDGAGYLSANELRALFEDAGVGNAFTRGIYVDKVFENLDRDGNAALSPGELAQVLGDSGVVPPPMGPPTPEQLRVYRQELESQGVGWWTWIVWAAGAVVAIRVLGRRAGR